MANIQINKANTPTLKTINHLCVVMFYKKVLLRERKRHTACDVANISCAALSPGEGGYSHL